MWTLFNDIIENWGSYLGSFSLVYSTIRLSMCLYQYILSKVEASMNDALLDGFTHTYTKYVVDLAISLITESDEGVADKYAKCHQHIQHIVQILYHKYLF